MWLSIAAAQGNPVSQEQLAEVAPYMSSDDLAESKRQSAAWLQKPEKLPRGHTPTWRDEALTSCLANPRDFISSS